MSTNKTAEVITDRILELLKKGSIPWRKPWTEGAALGEHQNLISQHQYRGINAMLTAAAGFESPYWLTFKQASDHGGSVRKGERGTPIVFWAFGVNRKDNGDEKKWAFARYSTVFNLDQIEGLDSIKLLAKRRKQERIEFNPLERCEQIVNGYAACPEIVFREQRAFYRPSLDQVNMPKRESFKSVETYYATLFHELAHSTGHVSRLNRAGITEKHHFGDETYSKEELIAEMGSAFLCGVGGIDSSTLDQSASYISGWIRTLKGDSRLVLTAASAAQKATDLILGKKPETDPNAQ